MESLVQKALQLCLNAPASFVSHITSIPNDMKLSALLGVTLCAGFLVLGNKKTPYVKFSQWLDGESEVNVMAEGHVKPISVGPRNYPINDTQNKSSGNISSSFDRNREGVEKSASADVNAANASETAAKLSRATAIGSTADLTAEEAAVMNKLKRFQAAMGVSDATMQQALELTEAQAREAALRGEDGGKELPWEQTPTSIFKVLDKLVWIFLLVLGVWALQEHTNGEAGRIFAGVFPREVEALGLMPYLQKYQTHILTRRTNGSPTQGADDVDASVNAEL